MKTITYSGLRAYRKDGKIVIEIPEAQILQDASDPLHPADPVYRLRDGEHLLEQLVERLATAETDHEDYPQARMRGVVRECLQELADEGESIEHPVEFQPLEEFRRAS